MVQLSLVISMTKTDLNIFSETAIKFATQIADKGGMASDFVQVCA